MTAQPHTPRRIPFFCIALAALAAFTLALPAAAQTGQLVGLGDKCADVFQAGTDDGTPVVLWQCTGNANQQWSFSPNGEIVGLGGTCLVPGPVGTSGHPELEIGPCGTSEATWSVGGSLGSSFQLVHDETGLCADVFGSQTDNGTPLILFECLAQANQEWRLVGDRALPAYIVPYYQWNNFIPRTTLFAVRNPSPDELMVRYEYFRDDQGPGELVVSETLPLAGHAVRTVDLRLVSGLFEPRGWIGITAVDPSTGQPLAVQDLYGDYFRFDPAQNFATGDQILAADEALCNTWHVRFLSGGDFNGGTRFRFLVPQFSGETWTADARVFTEQGEEIQSFSFTTNLHSLERPDVTLPLIPNFGTVEWTFRDGVVGHVSVVMDALGRFSVGFEAECRD